jgi:riboflavin kinase
MDRIELLLAIAEETKLGEAVLSTHFLGKKLSRSQQAISNQLRSLQALGLISRTATSKGMQISLTTKGIEVLKSIQHTIEASLKGPSAIVGTVFSGLKEGRFYTRLPTYLKQFKDKLGIDPFPGTLNLRVVQPEKNIVLAQLKGIRIEGFSTKDRTFGALKAYPVKIEKLSCAILMPDRTSHKDTLEIICSENLRKKLAIKDNDQVKVKK